MKVYRMRCALRYLAERGHMKVGYIDQISDTCHVHRRLATFKAASGEFGIQTRGDWYSVIEREYITEKNSIQLRTMFGSEDRPTALLFSSFLPATTDIVSELKSMGLSLPADVSLIGFDDSPWARCMEPALTVIEQPLKEMGRRAAERLVEQINGEGCINQEVLPVNMVERRSVAIVKAFNGREALGKHPCSLTSEQIKREEYGIVQSIMDSL